MNGLDSLTLDQERPLIDCIHPFIGDLDAIVKNETAGWVAEFRAAVESIESVSTSDSSGTRETPSSPV